MNDYTRGLCGFCAILLYVTSAHAAVTGYTSETEYINALSALGHSSIQESFEDDAVWGSVRSTISSGFFAAPSITNLGVTWTANNSSGGVTTGHGPARTGDWGFYAYPHGDFANGIGDGFIGTSGTLLYGIGGWFDGFYGAEIDLILDNDTQNIVDFDGLNRLAGPSLFLGVIDTEGFTRFEIVETEFTPPDEAKYIFADDFTFGVPTPIPSTQGDLDEDGDVDSTDLNLLLSGFDSPPSLLEEVNLKLLLTNFGRTDMGGKVVPEPSAVILWCMGICGLLGTRYRRKK